MRPDMHEVLIERPRRGMRRKSHRGNRPQPRDWVDDESFAADYRPRRHRDKYFSDLLSPLRRWLRSQVGRPWAKVYSELVSGVDTRTVVGRHLMDHANWEVEQHCKLDADGKPLTLGGWGNQWREPKGLYVHPSTGLLRWHEQPRRRRHVWHWNNDTPDVVELNDDLFRMRRAGIWFWVQAQAIATLRYGESPGFRHHGRPYRIVGLRQMSTRELRALGLSNEVAD